MTRREIFTRAIWVALPYTLVTSIAISFAWHFDTPGHHGFDWILVSFLTAPGSLLVGYSGPSNLYGSLIGLALEASLIYVCVTLGVLISEFRDRRRPPKNVRI